jgi:hypothetical protein
VHGQRLMYRIDTKGLEVCMDFQLAVLFSSPTFYDGNKSTDDRCDTVSQSYDAPVARTGYNKPFVTDIIVLVRIEMSQIISRKPIYTVCMTISV